MLKLAPTGKASYLLKSNTVHTGLKVPINRTFEYSRLNCDSLNTFRAHYSKVDVLFIDEVSMVGSGMLNFINLRFQEIMANHLLFGGCSVICLGDLFQLKPVCDSWIFKKSKQGYGLLAPNIWQDNFKLYELTQIIRQKDDISFALLLNRLREGKHTNSDIDVLKTRLQCNKEVADINITQIFPINADVNSHNKRVFDNALSFKTYIKSIDIIVGDLSDVVKEKMKERIPNDATKTMGLFSVLAVAVGLRYDLTANISVLDGLTNGAECIVKRIDYRVLNSSRPRIIWVLFQDCNIGKNWRKEYSHLYDETAEQNWTPILEISRRFKINKNRKGDVMRRQFPLQPSSAKTVHRCQGDTVDRIVIELPARRSEHMHYVALSRVKNLSGLHILSLNKNKITVSKKVEEEMKRLRTKAPLILYVPFLHKKIKHTTKNIISKCKITSSSLQRCCV